MRVPSFNAFAVIGSALLLSCGGSDGGSSQLLELSKWTPSGENQTDTVGQTLPKVIRVLVTLDSQPAAGYTVHFAGGNLGTTDMVTGADGIATSSWTLGHLVGAQTVTASVTGAFHSPQTFHATAVHDTAQLLLKVSGDSQIVTTNAGMQQLVLKVTDQYGNPVSGKWIAFSKTGPVVLGADSIITLDDGKATLNLSAGATPGTYQVTATSVSSLVGSPGHFDGDVVSTIATVNVGQGGNLFSPSNTVITAGNAVKWVWVGGTHSVTPDSAMGFNDTQLQIAPFSVGPILFNSTGVYAFHCSAHVGMTGTVTVN